MARDRAWRRHQAERRKRKLRVWVTDMVAHYQTMSANRGERPSRWYRKYTAEQYWRKELFKNEGKGWKPWIPRHGCRCSWCLGTYLSREKSLVAAARDELADWQLGSDPGTSQE
jgi:hypothetical protein